MPAKTLKLWLDDERSPPDDSWTWFDSAETIIAALRKLNSRVLAISLDHDLGDRIIYGSGYEVMIWIETEVHTNDAFVCPYIKLHTQNPEGRRMMMLAIQSIERKLKQAVFSH